MLHRMAVRRWISIDADALESRNEHGQMTVIDRYPFEPASDVTREPNALTGMSTSIRRPR